MARCVGAVLAFSLAGCAHMSSFAAPDPDPDFVALPRSARSVALDATAPSEDVETCVHAFCVRNLRRAMEGGVDRVFLGLAARGAPNDYVGTLDLIRLTSTPIVAGRYASGAALALTWHFTLYDAHTAQTLISIGDTEAGIGGSYPSMLQQAEHRAMARIADALGRFLAAR